MQIVKFSTFNTTNMKDIYYQVTEAGDRFYQCK